jgi:hypothetical protein
VGVSSNAKSKLAEQCEMHIFLPLVGPLNKSTHKLETAWFGDSTLEP